ncbi:DinB family protein [Planotetraspora sp. A-T 1434]|uniref:DinB family protein n=1 Tax=Planotetraspora sp. A-T 1434 TaxID=2979219 RepID=UPI0021BE92ED|nr:DinB family protein [Planotetraspora sp. A-T 1434]MCT9933820.1 DinB family protein [Planotetraspora sp. A-T 1434]
MTDTRIDPPPVADEREMLTSWLDWHRETLAVKCAGLTEEQLRLRSAPPSTISLLGLVRHMADVERSWFRRRLNGEDLSGIYFSDDDPDGEFDNVDTASAEEAFATWRAEVALAREAAAAAPGLDTLAKREREGVRHSLRWILVHMIEEYARHNGHADILRERIDGVTGE